MFLDQLILTNHLNLVPKQETGAVTKVLFYYNTTRHLYPNAEPKNSKIYEMKTFKSTLSKEFEEIISRNVSSIFHKSSIHLLWFYDAVLLNARHFVFIFLETVHSKTDNSDFFPFTFLDIPKALDSSRKWHTVPKAFSLLFGKTSFRLIRTLTEHRLQKVFANTAENFCWARLNWTLTRCHSITQTRSPFFNGNINDLIRLVDNKNNFV